MADSAVPQGSPVPHRSRRVLRCLVVVVAASTILSIAIYFVFPQVFIVAGMRVKFPRRDSPDLYVVPTNRELRATGIAGDKVRSFEKQGVRFRTPWGEVIEERGMERATSLAFGGKTSLLIFGSVQPITEVVITMFGGQGEDRDAIRAIFGEDSFRSDYNLYKAMLNSTPDKLSIFSSRQEAAALSILVLLKAMAVQLWGGGLYSFSTGRVRGFQQGKPGESERVMVRMFDPNDRPIEMLFRGDLRPEEVDFVLLSVGTEAEVGK